MAQVPWNFLLRHWVLIKKKFDKAPQQALNLVLSASRPPSQTPPMDAVTPSCCGRFLQGKRNFNKVKKFLA